MLARALTEPSRAEMLFIVVLFHLSPYKNFKVFYLYGISGQYRACFDGFCQGSRQQVSPELG